MRFGGGADPTVKQLEALAAETFDKEAGLFVPRCVHACGRDGGGSGCTPAAPRAETDLVFGASRLYRTSTSGAEHAAGDNCRKLVYVTSCLAVGTCAPVAPWGT